MCELLEYNELLEKYRSMQRELESSNQALHECKIQLKTARSIEIEYLEEIKSLQVQGTVEQQKLEVRIHELEESNQNLRATSNESTEYLERQIANKEEEIKILTRDLEDILRIKDLTTPAPSNNTLDEVSYLKTENLHLCTQVSELEASLLEQEKEKCSLQEMVKQLKVELEDYKENLSIKSQEVRETKEQLQNLKEEYICLKSEMDLLKSQPLDNQSRGNSLFAEVDDRRVQLQQNMNTMKTRYLEMKQERASLLNEITRLRNENMNLIGQWEAEVIGREQDERTILDSYKNQIQTLNELVENYKKELQEKSTTSCDYQGMKFLDNMLTMKKNEIENLRQQLLTRSVNHTSLSYDLAEANKQNRKCSLEILQLKNEIGNLKVKIQEMEMKSPVEKKQPVEVKLPKSIVKVPEDTANKENDDTNKAVRFSEATIEPQVTDRSKYRKGAKVLISNPIKYS